ncbi:AAA family ATPase [Kribbella monticola]|uniref:AAA family ATPase n=1 Tax=Kribbella monticola TaxID=2185285 RepID=UPI001300AD96|nr:AAA family ATPase [Kribbella monticola]
MNDRPEWLSELSIRLATSPHLVLVGAPNEQHLLPAGDGRPVWRTFTHAVTGTLLNSGYSLVLQWSVDGGLTPIAEAAPGLAGQLLGGHGGQSGDQVIGDAQSLMTALRVVDAFSPSGTGMSGRAALIVIGAERLAESSSASPLREVFAVAQQRALAAVPQPSGGTRGQLFNTVLWTVNREHDLPNWYLMTRGVHVLSIPLPDQTTRRQVARSVVSGFQGYGDLSEDERTSAGWQLADLCEGMTQAQMREVGRFAVDRKVEVAHLEDAVRGTRSGLRESPWRSDAMRARVVRAGRILLEKEPPGDSGISLVRGQKPAVRQAVDVLSRSVTGLSDWDESEHSSRPRGVLFLAGPTGVGKTFLAKQLAIAVFGRVEAMVRFDMSEYATSHSEARLIGSPPGYVGYESGGQLTNAVRQRPCSLLLFDEIDKAHPLVLDKFLQILEDGRLTDGSGSTVHFGETLLVFTSNLGIYRRDGEIDSGKPLVLPGEPYDQVESKVRAEVNRHFTSVLKRPEILNRIGDNILVFDYLSEQTARDLLKDKVDTLSRTVKARRDVEVRFGVQVLSELGDIVAGEEVRQFGGRGVKNVVESRLVNPLGRELLEHGHGSVLRVDALTPDGLRQTGG